MLLLVISQSCANCIWDYIIVFGMICYFQEAKDDKGWLWHACAAAVCCAAHTAGNNNLNEAGSNSLHSWCHQHPAGKTALEEVGFRWCFTARNSVLTYIFLLLCCTWQWVVFTEHSVFCCWLFCGFLQTGMCNLVLHSDDLIRPT